MDTGYAIIAPTESRDHVSVRSEIDRIIADPSNPITAVHYFDLRESMRNGGGPACLRLRVPLTSTEQNSVASGCILSRDGKADAAQFARLESWVRKHYRETLIPREIADPKLMHESRAALDELTQILGLGSIYEFQRGQ